MDVGFDGFDGLSGRPRSRSQVWIQGEELLHLRREEEEGRERMEEGRGRRGGQEEEEEREESEMEGRGRQQWNPSMRTP